MKNRLPIYSEVEILTDKYKEFGVLSKTKGVIIEIYEDGYEIEFMDEQGNTIDCFGVKPDEIEVVE